MQYLGRGEFYGVLSRQVAVFPALGLLAIITTTNFRERDAHPLSDRLITDYILPAADAH